MTIDWINHPMAGGETIEAAFLPSRATQSQGCFVLWPCMGGDCRMYNMPVEQFTENGWDVLLYNPRGHGHSTGYLTVETAAADLTALLDLYNPSGVPLTAFGHHVQTGNRNDFLSLNFGLAEFGVEDALRLKKYREYLYHAGAVKKRGKAKIPKKVLEEATSNDFELGRIQRLRYRSRYFTGSGIIGSKASVLSTYELFKNRLYASRECVPKRGRGFSMKRISET